MLSCELGDVVDISKTGMRVRCSRKPPVKVGQTVSIKLDASGQSLPVNAVVVWVRRTGFRSYQVGFQFANLSSAVTAAIESVALYGFVDLDAARRSAGGSSGKKKKEKVVAAVELPDYYELLEVRSDATQQQIQDAYRLLARKYHPDVNQDPESVQHFIKVTEAYEVLRDIRARKGYDQRRQGQAA